MIFSENRYTLFRIMLQVAASLPKRPLHRRPADLTKCRGADGCPRQSGKIRRFVLRTITPRSPWGWKPCLRMQAGVPPQVGLYLCCL